MPSHDFVCGRCGHSEEIWRETVSEPFPARCPCCGSRKYRQFYGRASPVVVDGVVRTFGQAAAENAKRLGKEQLALMAEKEKERLKPWNRNDPPWPT